MNLSVNTQISLDKTSRSHAESMTKFINPQIRANDRYFKIQNRLPTSIKTTNNFFANKKFHNRVNQLKNNYAVQKGNDECMSVQFLKQKMSEITRNYNHKSLKSNYLKPALFHTQRDNQNIRKIRTERGSQSSMIDFHVNVKQMQVKKQPLRIFTQNQPRFPLSIKARDAYNKKLQHNITNKRYNSFTPNTRSKTSCSKFNLTEINIQNIQRRDQKINVDIAEHNIISKQLKNSALKKQISRTKKATKVFQQRKKNFNIKQKNSRDKIRYKKVNRQKAQLFREQSKFIGWETKNIVSFQEMMPI